MWVRFIAPFDWCPPERKGRVTLAFATGAVLFVRRACGAAAVAAGKAVVAHRPGARA